MFDMVQQQKDAAALAQHIQIPLGALNHVKGSTSLTCGSSVICHQHPLFPEHRCPMIYLGALCSFCRNQDSCSTLCDIKQYIYFVLLSGLSWFNSHSMTLTRVLLWWALGDQSWLHLNIHFEQVKMYWTVNWLLLSSYAQECYEIHMEALCCGFSHAGRLVLSSKIQRSPTRCCRTRVGRSILFCPALGKSGKPEIVSTSSSRGG